MKIIASEKELIEIVRQNKILVDLLNRIPELKLPNWYLGAGCITGTVWNYLHKYELNTGIKDYDLVYFDADTSYEKEDQFISLGERVFQDLNVDVEIRNEARVHLWYEKHFGYNIQPYRSVEAAINTWPTTATAIAVRIEKQEIKVYSPFGFTDLFSMIVRPNKVQITKEIYLRKVERWVKIWPKLKVMPWD